MNMASETQKFDSDSFLQGKLLVAMPGMSDPRFEQSVIFMCVHSDEGAMGIIINKAIDGIEFQEMLDRLEVNTGKKAPKVPILFGGPMQTTRGFVLHSGDFRSSEENSTLEVTSEISLTTTLDILRAMGSGTGPEKSLFALGYAGWDGGQIEDEIRANAWIHCDADPGLVFDTSLDAKWNGALGKLGIDISGFSAQVGRA